MALSIRDFNSGWKALLETHRFVVWGGTGFGEAMYLAVTRHDKNGNERIDYFYASDLKFLVPTADGTGYDHAPGAVERSKAEGRDPINRLGKCKASKYLDSLYAALEKAKFPMSRIGADLSVFDNIEAVLVEKPYASKTPGGKITLVESVTPQDWGAPAAKSANDAKLAALMGEQAPF